MSTVFSACCLSSSFNNVICCLFIVGFLSVLYIVFSRFYLLVLFLVLYLCTGLCLLLCLAVSCFYAGSSLVCL